MKTAAKKWYNYAFIVLVLGIIFCAAYLPYVFTHGVEWPAKYVRYSVFFYGVGILLIGFIIQDIYRATVRHKINDWDNKLDQKYIDKAWAIYYPLFVSGLTATIVGLAINLILK